MNQDRIRRGSYVLGLSAISLIMAGGKCLDDPAGQRDERWTALACPAANWVTDFGEVFAGTEAYTPFTARNPSRLSDDPDEPDRMVRSKVRILGFSASECGAEEPPFSVVGPFPLDLIQEESRELQIRYAPTTGGEHSCILEPEVQVLEWPIGPALTPDEVFINCSLSVSGTGVWGPEPVCEIHPSADFDFGEVETGSHGELAFFIRNLTTDPLLANQFRYLFDSPSSDCRLFTIDPADTMGVIGPGESKEITVRFAPDGAGIFECTRNLSSLKEPADPSDPYIANPCPWVMSWRGTGVIGASVWAQCSPPAFEDDLHGVFGLSANEVYAAGDGGQVLQAAGDCNWQPIGTGFDDVNLRDIWVYEEGGQKALWAVGNIPPPQGSYGETGAILRSEGGAWSKVDEDGLLTFDAVWGSGLEDVYFAGLGVSSDFPNAKRWDGAEDQGGLIFSEFIISFFGMSEVTGLSGTGSTDVWASLLQSFNSVYRFRGGEEWEDWTPTPPTKVLHDVWAVQGNGFYAVYAVGEDGAIYHHDGTEGNPWADESIPGEERDFYGVWVSQTGRVFVVGEGPVVYRGDVNDPTGWVSQSLPEGLPVGALMDVWGVTAEDVYAVGTNGLVLHYRPEGVTPGG